MMGEKAVEPKVYYSLSLDVLVLGGHSHGNRLSTLARVELEIRRTLTTVLHRIELGPIRGDDVSRCAVAEGVGEGTLNKRHAR
jgi:hypothetical protein